MASQTARKVDDLTVDFLLSAPDAVLPEKFVYVGIMSKAWAAAHGVIEPQNYNARQGDLRRSQRQRHRALPAQELRIRCQARCWSPIPNGGASAATSTRRSTSSSSRMRRAWRRLISGQVDFVIDPPFQDVARLKQEGKFKLADTTDIGTQYLGFDQSRDELQFSDVKGKNPFKDLRVRRAVYQAIDIDAIVSQGAARPGHRDRLVFLALSRWVRAGARSPAAV